MSLKLRAALAAASLLLLMGPAYAQCHSGAFNGPYIGGSVGWGHYRAEQSSVGEPDAHSNDNTFVPGLYAGYNMQCGRWVVGVETDINYAGFSAKTSWPDPIFLKSDVDWFGTTRGRLGVLVHQDTLLYATAGVAYAGVSQRLFDPAPPLGGPFSQTDSETKTGWTVGGGLEFLRSDRWSLRTEVLYVDLGDNSRTYTLSTGCGGVCTGTAEWKDSFWVGRLGLTLKFGARPEPVPLK